MQGHRGRAQTRYSQREVDGGMGNAPSNVSVIPEVVFMFTTGEKNHDAEDTLSGCTVVTNPEFRLVACEKPTLLEAIIISLERSFRKSRIVRICHTFVISVLNKLGFVREIPVFAF